MDLIDGAVTRAKEAFDVACKKTNEVVAVQKQKFEAASLESRLSKDFETLGRLYYDVQRNGAMAGDGMETVMDAIEDKQAKLAVLKGEILRAKGKKICTECGATLPAESLFCNYCGKPVADTDEVEVDEAEPAQAEEAQPAEPDAPTEA